MFRRGSTVFLALLVLAALVPSAGAQIIQVPVPVELCPSNTPLSGFTDTAGLPVDVQAAINCMAYLRIARGTSPTTFSPNATVTRWQMALFLTRTLTALGVPLPSGTSQGFTDLGVLDSATQIAINQLAQLGIAQGTSATTFDSNGIVNRWQMALFLTRFLSKTGFSLPNPTPYGFTDIGSLDATTQAAINQLRQTGIAMGTSVTTYSPNNDVVRWQMALFLSPVLNVGKKPALKITIQGPAIASDRETVTLTITVRNPDGTPMPGRNVDVFVWSSSLPDGTNCNLDLYAKVNGIDPGTGTDCVIDAGDPTTNSVGTATVLLTYTATGKMSHIVAWIGTAGERFSNQATQGSFDLPLGYLISVSHQFPRRAGTVLSDFWVMFAGSGLTTYRIPGQLINFSVQRNGAIVLIKAIETNTEGTAPLSYLGPLDPGPGDDPQVTDYVTVFWDKDRDGIFDSGEFWLQSTVIWDDELPYGTFGGIYAEPAGSNRIGSATTFHAIVRDKFTAPVSGATVNFFDSTGLMGSSVTDATGSASIVVFGPPSPTDEFVSAVFDLNGNGMFDPGDIGPSEIGVLPYKWTP